MRLQTPTFDIFVIYGYPDAAWVASGLITRLDGWGVSFAVDFNDFVPGYTIESETQRLICESRRSLIVLSAGWVDSPWAGKIMATIGNLVLSVSQLPALVLRIQELKIPDALRNCEVIDITAGEPDEQWLTLRRALLRYEAPLGTNIVEGEMTIWRAASEKGVTGYSYVADLCVANPRNHDLEFDGVRIEFVTLGAAPKIERPVASMTLCDSGGQESGSYIYYSHGKATSRSSSPEWSARHGLRLKPMRLKAFTALNFDKVDFRESPFTVPGICVVMVAVCLTVGDIAISDRCWCALPPLLRMPELEAGRGWRLELPCERYLPPLSGLLDRKTTRMAFATANRLLQAPVLDSLMPDFVTTHKFGKRTILHNCGGWHFQFYDRADRSFWRIYSDDPFWISRIPELSGESQAAEPLTLEQVEACMLDCREAYLVARAAAATIDEQSGRLHLLCGLPGRTRPIWSVPAHIDGAPVGVLADTGEIVIEINGQSVMPPKSVWNRY